MKSEFCDANPAGTGQRPWRLRVFHVVIAEAVALPVEERPRIVENLLSSLNPPEPGVDAAWASVAGRRLDERCSGSVESVPGEVVFERIRQLHAQ